MGHGETKQECLLHEALLDAFPDPKTLERIVQLGLDENLNGVWLFSDDAQVMRLS
jgi:hypothetical protein